MLSPRTPVIVQTSARKVCQMPLAHRLVTRTKIRHQKALNCQHTSLYGCNKLWPPIFKTPVKDGSPYCEYYFGDISEVNTDGAEQTQAPTEENVVHARGPLRGSLPQRTNDITETTQTVLNSHNNGAETVTTHPRWSPHRGRGHTFCLGHRTSHCGPLLENILFRGCGWTQICCTVRRIQGPSGTCWTE